MNQFRYFDQEPLYEADWLCAVRSGNKNLAKIVRKGMQKIPQADKAAVFVNGQADSRIMEPMH